MKQTTNNRGKRIAAGVAGGVLVLGLLLAADAAYGDPLSRAWAESRAVQYAENLYPGQTFIVTASYDGSRFEYGALVQSEQSPDTRFEVRTSFWLFTTDDGGEDDPSSHEWLVEQRWNTAYRMGTEAAAQVDAILAEELPQYEFAANYGGGEPQRSSFVSLGYDPDEGAVPGNYAEYLPMDAAFSKDILQNVPARLMLQCAWPTTPTQADVDTVLAQVKQVMEANGYRFAWYNITLTDATAPDYQTGLERLAESGDVAAADIPAAVATPETAG